MFETLIALGGLLLSGVGMIQGQSSQNAARKAAEAARKTEAAQANLKLAQERRKQASAAMISRANFLATTEAAGAAGSSAQLGGGFSLANQQAYNTSFLDQMSSLGNQGSAFSNSYAANMSDASTYKGFSSLGASLFSNSSQISSAFDTVFSTPQTQPTPEPQVNTSGWNFGGSLK